MLSLSPVKCCDKSAKCYGHLGGDGGAHTHTFVWICFLLSKQLKSRDRLTYVSTLCAEAGGGGGFHHGVDAGKNTIDSDRLFCDFYRTSRLFFSWHFIDHFIYLRVFAQSGGDVTVKSMTFILNCSGLAAALC